MSFCTVFWTLAHEPRDELGVDVTHLVILVPTVLGGVDGGVVVQMTVICVGA